MPTAAKNKRRHMTARKRKWWCLVTNCFRCRHRWVGWQKCRSTKMYHILAKLSKSRHQIEWNIFIGITTVCILQVQGHRMASQNFWQSHEVIDLSCGSRLLTASQHSRATQNSREAPSIGAGAVVSPLPELCIGECQSSYKITFIVQTAMCILFFCKDLNTP